MRATIRTFALRLAFTAVVTLVAGPSTVAAQDGVGTDRLTIDLGGLLATMTSDIRIDSSSGARGTSIDADSVLGLDSNKAVFQAQAVWWITRRQRLTASYLDIKRDTSRQILTQPVQFGGRTFQLGTDVDSFLDTLYIGGSYGYAIVRTTSVEVGPVIGITTIGYAFGAALSTESGNSARDAGGNTKFTAPVPTIGAFLAVQAGPVAIAVQGGWLKVTISNIDINDSELRVSAIWRPWAHVGVGGGLLFSSLSAEAERDKLFGRIKSGFVGPQIFLQLGF